MTPTRTIEVTQDIDGEFAGERVVLKAGRYEARGAEPGSALPGSDVVDANSPAAAYLLKREGEPARGLSAEAMAQLQRQGFVVVAK